MIKWDVEVTLRETSTDEELDYFSMPYKSEQFEELFKRSRPWFPLHKSHGCFLVVRHRPSGRELRAPISVVDNKMQTWITVGGEKLRPKDALRVMMSQLDPGETAVDKRPRRGRS